MLHCVAFHTTRWSLISRASGDDAERTRALDELCTIYWPPVYALFRGEGLDAEAARDLTQGLFADLLARGDFARADPARGRFRAFLRGCARHYLTNERDRAAALKRGGGRSFVPLDIGGEETRFALEPVDRLDPGALFDRRWAQSVIESALQRLADDEHAAGRGSLWPLLQPVLDGGPPPRPWAEIARELGTTEGALKVAAHRLRARFRERLLAEVRETLDGEAPGDELQQLLAALQA
jgi:RNA polymerase sigma-70 factor (ECF subfamily)